MASSNSTASLGLNQWLGQDKPKREDFNSDNQKLDEALGGHLSDAARHITPEERAAWNALIPVTGSYTGDGQTFRTIPLGFKPSLGFVFTPDFPLMSHNGGTGVMQALISWVGVFLGDKSSLGISRAEDGFTLEYFPEPEDGRILNLNENRVVYQYCMFR